MPLDFIQCPFPNQIQFGLEKIHPKNASDFPNQFQFGLEKNPQIIGKLFQTKSSLVWKKILKLLANFSNQIQVGFENNCIEFGGKLIPNQIQFGLEKNAGHFSRQKSQTNSRLEIFVQLP